MGFSAICFSHKYLLIRNISGKSEDSPSGHFQAFAIAPLTFTFFTSYLGGNGKVA